MKKIWFLLKFFEPKRRKIWSVMKLCVIFTAFLSFSVSAKIAAQQEKVNLNLSKANLQTLFQEIQRQTGLYFVYNEELCNTFGEVNVNAESQSVKEVLDNIFRGKELTYYFEDKIIVVKANSPQTEVEKRKITGKVADKDGTPLPGVGILIEGTTVGVSTDVDGKYTIECPPVKDLALLFSFVGMKPHREMVGDKSVIDVIMQEELQQMDEVVVTGIFTRKKESFTGSTATFKKEELKMVGAQNVIQSLKTLDPSFVIMENNDYGSDPNRLPDIEIRGKSSIVGLREQYDTDPNQPLFILDGFETDLKTIVDLNMDRVESVTILKDAASTALYGSKAANGVVVIETKQPEAGKFRVTYNGNFSLSIPDLTDYNLMDAREKLEFEEKAGFYKSKYVTDAREQLFLDSLYNLHAANVARGVNTYWMSEPLRIALVQKHNLYAEGGDDAVRYGFGVTYNGTDGVMKQSGNDLIGCNFDLNYRKKQIRFYNKMSFDYSKEENPTVNFSNYAYANPYFEKRNADGKVDRYLEEYYTLNSTHYTVENPLYNASLNNYDKARKVNFVNNLNAEWQPFTELRIRGRIGVGKSIRKVDKFISPQHTMFDNYVRNQRGRYTTSETDSWYYDGDFTITFGKLFAERHQVNLVVGTNMRSTETRVEGYTAVGFPDGDFDRPSFSSGFQNGSKPNYSETVSRSHSFYVNFGYSYHNRYLLDANIRMDGSSVFGRDKLYDETWAVGLAWNIHNESFLKEIDWLNMLKVRASIGNPGNQNFESYQSYTTYSFNNWIQNNFGTSVIIDAFGNPDLKWQKTLDKNIGADLSFFGNRFNINFDYYQKKTDPLLAIVGVPASIGETTVTTNMGEQWNKGYSGTVKYSPIYRPQDRVNWTLSLNFRHQKSEYRNIGNSLDQFNKQNENTSLQRYYDGGSPTALWAVRSLGIDPASGKEVFLKKDGTYSFIYDTKDEVEVGDSEPDLEGVIGSTLYYKGFSFSVHLRYSFGGDVFNKALYSKVENISETNLRNNQDKRALYDRWSQAGQHAQFKGISLTETTPISSRFVKTENFIKGESFSVGYDFPKSWIEKAGFSALRLQANMNDIFRKSSVKEERGIEYPFARTVSASISVTF